MFTRKYSLEHSENEYVPVGGEKGAMLVKGSENDRDTVWKSSPIIEGIDPTVKFVDLERIAVGYVMVGADILPEQAITGELEDGTYSAEISTAKAPEVENGDSLTVIVTGEDDEETDTITYATSAITLTNIGGTIQYTEGNGWAITWDDSLGASVKIHIKFTDVDVPIPSRFIPNDLPAVTAADNGKVLTVVNGAWAVADLPTE